VPRITLIMGSKGMPAECCDFGRRVPAICKKNVRPRVRHIKVSAQVRLSGGFPLRLGEEKAEEIRSKRSHSVKLLPSSASVPFLRSR